MAAVAASVRVVLCFSAYALSASNASRSIMTRGRRPAATGATAGAAAAGAATAAAAAGRPSYSSCAFLILSNPTRLTHVPNLSFACRPVLKAWKMGSKNVSTSASLTLSANGFESVVRS